MCFYFKRYEKDEDYIDVCTDIYEIKNILVITFLGEGRDRVRTILPCF